MKSAEKNCHVILWFSYFETGNKRTFYTEILNYFMVCKFNVFCIEVF